MLVADECSFVSQIIYFCFMHQVSSLFHFRYTRIKHCLHKAPVGIEERGSDWPEEWPKRLETFPDWLGDLETRVAADHNHWKAVVEKSYLDGLGLNWSNIRNVMDMRAVYGGYAHPLILKLLAGLFNNMRCALKIHVLK
jgi:hypothetical protein